MSVHPIDFKIYGDDFGDPRIREIFSERGVVESWLLFEATLAQVQGELDMIPREAAEEIARKASLEHVSIERVAHIYRETRLSSVSLIRALREACEGGAGEYIHYGATTQDLFDTSLALRLKGALNIIDEEARQLHGLLVDLARRYRDTLMVGRTHGQHALPITLGFKLAVWSEAIREHLERFGQIKERLLVGNISGAVGNFASFCAIDAPNALRMQDMVLERLGLDVPVISIQPRTERLAEFMNLLSLVSLTLEKMAEEVFTLQRTEFGELEEPYDTEKQISSSTMPQKRNPIHAELIRALVRKIRSNAGVMSGAFMKEERDMSPFYLEDLIIPETCVLASTVLEAAKVIFSGLVVNEERMRRNLDSTKGLLMAEALMLELSKKTGRKETAMDLVHTAAMISFEKGVPFTRAVLEDEAIGRHFSADDLERILSPEHYLGLTRALVDRVVSGHGQP
ncbi:MAG: adenylosuccinate lyase [Deltaproteobacteria bacterium]|nr:adenylosuccinate lyase [Deltaproteobacteria bacterium]